MPMKIHCWLIALLSVLASTSGFADEFSEAAAKGKKLYNGAFCVVCHGQDGKGEYPEWVREKNIEGTKDTWGRRAPDLNDSQVLQDPERTAVVLLKGIEWDRDTYELPMWYWYNEGQDQELADMVTFLRSEFGGFRELTTAAQVAEWKEKYANIPAIEGAEPGPENIVGGIPREQLEKINTAAQSADDSTHSGAAADTNAPQEEQVASDREAIQGVWQVTAMRAAGNPGPESIIAASRYHFDGETLTIKLGESRSDDYTFTLDPAAKPMAACDMTPLGSQDPAATMKGIYKVEGDSLIICLGKHQRPTEMRAEEEDGFGQVLIELQRAKP